MCISALTCTGRLSSGSKKILLPATIECAQVLVLALLSSIKPQTSTTECNSCLGYQHADSQTDNLSTRAPTQVRLLARLGGSLPRKAACRQIEYVSGSATQTRKSLVKGERFIRSVWMAEMAERCDRGGNQTLPTYPGPSHKLFIGLSWNKFCRLKNWVNQDVFLVIMFLASWKTMPAGLKHNYCLFKDQFSWSGAESQLWLSGVWVVKIGTVHCQVIASRPFG